ncbi:hypothetical protein ACFXG4_41345 [Nocardia sp. NPDC059246]|uniref:hypothetical protein n=1 Tax=unclassified Nocardia TaxID=2637762 RepID=UPI003699E28B
MTSLRPDSSQPARRIPRTASGAPTTRLLAAAILCCGMLAATVVDMGTAAAYPILCSWGPGVQTDCSDLFTPTPPEPGISPVYPQFQTAPSQIELPRAQPDPDAAP